MYFMLHVALVLDPVLVFLFIVQCSPPNIYCSHAKVYAFCNANCQMISQLIKIHLSTEEDIFPK